MALYLQMDGVDDYLRTPQVTVDRIVMEFMYEQNNPPATTAYYMFDARGGTPSGNYMVFINSGSTLTKGSNISSLKLDDVTVATTAAVTAGTRYKIDATYPSSLSEANGIEFFVNFAFQNTTRTKGKIYRVTGYNAGSVVFDYNMLTGTVQDQSGNGKHGILTGGTWVDDGIGGGTDGSNTLLLTNQLYKDNQSLLNFNNVIFKDSQTLLNLIQSIYADGSTTLSLIQSIFDASSTFVTLDLKQVIYQDSNIALNTLQTIYKDTQSGLNMIQQMYKNNSIDLSLILEIRNDIYVYKQLLETIFKINKQLETKMKLQNEVNTTFKINKEIEIVFKI